MNQLIEALVGPSPDQSVEERKGTVNSITRYIAAKGSIAVDGISLTVAGLLDESFTIAIIPHTLQHTNLSQVRPGSRVNLEVDVLARYVERLMTGGNSRHNPPAAGLSVESLRDLGP